jgi:hypothetical protein
MTDEVIRCECGNDKFSQEVMYVAKEEVVVSQDEDGNFNILSTNMIGVRANPEHFNQFHCDKCMADYKLEMVDGKKTFRRTI